MGFPALGAATPQEHGDGVAFGATIPGPFGSHRQGIWSERDGQLRKLLLQGEPLPGMPEGAQAFQFAFVSRGEAVVVESNWSCDGCFLADEGLWRDTGLGLQPVVKRGDPAPGFRHDAFFEDGGARTGPIDSWNAGPDGRFIFNGYVAGPRIDGDEDEGMFVETASGLELLAREGERVPGEKRVRWGSATGFRSFGDFDVMRVPIVAADGSTLFGASIHDGRHTFGAVFSTRRDVMEQLVRTVFPCCSDSPPLSLATAAPGFPAGHYFRQVFAGRMNAAGDVVLDADVAHEDAPGTPIAALFRIDRGSKAIGLVARVDGPAPGIPGAQIAEARIGRLFETGHHMWIGRLKGAGVDDTNDVALFLTGPDGSTRPVLRAGDLVDVQGDGSDRRVLAGLAQDDGARSGDARVEQVLELRFADGTAGVFAGRLAAP